MVFIFTLFLSTVLTVMPLLSDQDDAEVLVVFGMPVSDEKSVASQCNCGEEVDRLFDSAKRTDADEADAILPI